MFKKKLLIIILLSSFVASSQSNYSQIQAIKDINEINKSFGASGTNTISASLAYDPNDHRLYYKSYFTKDRTVVKGKTYRNMRFKLELILKNVNYVYEDGNKLFFDLNSNGYNMNIKAPGESWIGYHKYTNDFYFTIYDSRKRKKALKAFKFLVKHPLYYK